MTVVFIAKKLLTAALLPPGVFVIILIITALAVKNKLRIWLFILACLFYAVSIEPVADVLLRPLEDAYGQPTPTQVAAADAYVVLGGGTRENAPDMSGPGVLADDALVRVVTAYRLYRVHRKPIILSGGKVFSGVSEADVGAKMLRSLGIARSQIIKEDRSFDTDDNARYVKEIAERSGIRKIVLITSAYHMKRSHMLFSRYFKDIVAYPAHYETARHGCNLMSWLPEGQNLTNTGKALKEYIGIVFYRLMPFPNQDDIAKARKGAT